MRRDGGEEARRKLREGAARFGIGDMDRALDLRFGPGDHRHRSRLDRGGNEILSIHARALKRAENGAGRDLAVVDGEAGHLGLAIGRTGETRLRAELRQLHRFASGIKGLMSEMSMSRVLSGRTPSIGPMRGTRRPTIGAAFQAAVRWKLEASVPCGSSSMAITT